MTTMPSGTTPPVTGHVFVVHGRMELIVHDGAIVPTDRSFSVRRYWDALLGTRGSRLKPHDWRQGRRHGRASDDRPVWFVDVGQSAPEHDIAWLVDGVAAALDDAARQLITRRAQRAPQQAQSTTERAVPLLLVPVMGIGGGGFGGRRGDVVVALLDAAEKTVGQHGIDIAFTTPDRAVHAAVQHLRRERARWPLTPKQVVLAMDLADRAREGGLALLLGAGVSIAAGLPTWSQLLETVGRAAGVVLDEKTAHSLGSLDVADLLRRRLGDRELGRRVAAECTVERHALAHALLVALGCREVVTTNYDRCYEMAAGIDGEASPSVLPWGAPTGGRPWLLKIHGDVEHHESIVLARRHFVRFDAEQRPSASLLQSVMLTRHLLVVGASLADDNVLRLSHEVAAFRESHHVHGAYGTVLDVGGTADRRELWADELGWHVVPGESHAERARELEIFLDVLASLATTDASWLLDERFEGMLPADEQVLASDVRRLAERLPTTGSWGGLTDALVRRGAPPA